MLYEEWKSRYKNLKNFNTVLQRCPRFWPLAPPRGMNPGVYSLGISEDPPRYRSSKFDASVRSDCWDISIWKTLTQCDGNGNANADDRGDYNSSPSYRRAFFFFFFFFFDLGFTALSRIFHLYRADRSSKVGENRRTRRKTTWPSVSRTWLSHIWPERGSNHSGEKPNGLRVNSLIH